ncbi:MAG: hypothetical protein J4N26_03850 [Chloroflexi bacterium]|nr:hypothetical protein [Chloroflexota bacterium]
MPDASRMATFNAARRTGLTKTTRALLELFNAKNGALIESMGSGELSGLPDWARTALASHGLSAGELDHIRDWPDAQKNRARVAVVNAWNSNGKVRFLWKLWDNPKENVQIRTDPNGTVVITFFSPWDKVRVLGEDNITVDV